MSLYGFIVLIHIISAICGLGASFASPVLLSRPKTVKQAEFAITVNHAIDKVVVIGIFALLGSGLIMGALNTTLFSQVWYVFSLILFITVLPVAGFIVPKKVAQQVEILKKQSGNELPDSYIKIHKQMAPYNGYVHLASVIIIIFMVTKPF